MSRNFCTKGCRCGRHYPAKRPPHGKFPMGEYNGTRTGRSWISMINRCLNPNFTSYKNYGGRGIRICDRWVSSFLNFLDDMGERPEGMSLDRKNNDGDYSPKNCRWATRKEQNVNKSTTRLLTAFGETKPMSIWAQDPRCLVKYDALGWRKCAGWSDIRAITTPHRWGWAKP